MERSLKLLQGTSTRFYDVIFCPVARPLSAKKTLARPDIRIRIRRSIIRIRINETVISPIIRIAAHEQGHW